MQKVWNIRHTRANVEANNGFVNLLLHDRGLSTPEAVEDFLHPNYAHLHDPFLFKDMEKAVKRIWQAIHAKENILIYSDYDADAITANAVLFRLFKALGVTVDTYIPDRFTEGYGLNVEAFRKIRARNVDVVITVDCGTNSVSEAEFCKQNDIDLIITDHHEITGEVPDSFALINPKNPTETYPYHELVGVGVAFKLATAILKHNTDQTLPEGYEKWLLDLVAIGTVADLHALIGENRIFVKYGMQVLAKTRWIGLKKLMALAGIDLSDPTKQGDTYPIGFIIAPRINAAGRIDHAGLAFNLLTTDDPNEAEQLARDLENLNTRRQQITEVVMSEAREQLFLIQDHKILLATAKDWPKGVVGLVAGKLTEEFQKPVLILEKGETQSTGSARSTKDLNIVDALKNVEDVLVRYGGHAAAAGMTIDNENVDIFYKRLLEYAEREMPSEHTKVVDIDVEIQLADINLQNYKTLQTFQPFGVGNPKPRFVVRNLQLEQFQCVGKTQQHLQATFSAIVEESGKKSMRIKSIGFGFGSLINQFSAGQTWDVVFEMIADAWQGVQTVKMRLIDLRKSEIT